MKLIIAAILFAVLRCFAPLYAVGASGPQQKDNKVPAFYAAVNSLLQEHVRQGQVDYALLKQHQNKLAAVVNQLKTYDLSKATASEKKAFYLNAYNMLVWQQVLQHYPLRSVMDVPGFFDKQQFKVAGEMLTLNELEKQKLLKVYNDARIHFALVCAARSCPPLLNKAYTPAMVEAQLEAQAMQTLQSNAFIRLQPKTGQVQVSELFKWYEQDFLNEASGIIAYINKYRKHPLKNQSIQYYTYDWALNESRR